MLTTSKIKVDTSFRRILIYTCASVVTSNNTNKLGFACVASIIACITNCVTRITHCHVQNGTGVCSPCLHQPHRSHRQHHLSAMYKTLSACAARAFLVQKSDHRHNHTSPTRSIYRGTHTWQWSRSTNPRRNAARSPSESWSAARRTTTRGACCRASARRTRGSCGCCMPTCRRSRACRFCKFCSRPPRVASGPCAEFRANCHVATLTKCAKIIYLRF